MSAEALSWASASVIVSWNSSFQIAMNSCMSASVNCISPTVPELIAEKKMHKPECGAGILCGGGCGVRHFSLTIRSVGKMSIAWG